MNLERKAISTWCALVRERAHEIGNSLLASTGEEFTTSGDLALDHEVAKALLDTRQKNLPNYGWANPDGSVTTARSLAPVTERKVQLLPILLFEIDWALTAPGVSWPEAYYVTYIPWENVRIVTASRDEDTIWGYTDLAIGMCKAVRGPQFGTKKILQSWWCRAHGAEPHLWATFCEAGLISEKRALSWGKEVLDPWDPESW